MPLVAERIAVLHRNHLDAALGSDAAVVFMSRKKYDSLPPAAKAAIDRYCAALEQATGAQFAVVTVKSLEGDPIEDTANKLYREWGVGKKGSNEGLLLLLSIEDKKQRAEVGYGLEPIIPDGYAGGVLLPTIVILGVIVLRAIIAA